MAGRGRCTALLILPQLSLNLQAYSERISHFRVTLCNSCSLYSLYRTTVLCTQCTAAVLTALCMSLFVCCGGESVTPLLDPTESMAVWPHMRPAP